MSGVYRWASSLGEEVLVLAIEELEQYAPGYTLTHGLVLYSEHDGAKAGDLRKFATCNLVPFASLQNRVR